MGSAVLAPAPSVAPVVEEFSTLTAKGQTTVPKTIRQLLSLSEGDQLAFRVDGGKVTVRRAEEARDDPAIQAFLSFLAKDIERSPDKLKTFSPALIAHMATLVDGIDVDPDAPIEGDVDL